VSIVVAVLASVLAFSSARSWAARIETTRPEVGPPVQVVVAARALRRGEVVPADALSTRTMPERYVPAGTVRDVAEAAGRIAVADVVAGEVVTAARLAHAHAGALAALVPPGLRALAVPAAAPPGGIVPGDRVDVLASFGGGQPHVETAGAALEVLKIQAGGGAVAGLESTQGLASVVLLVSPEEAERLAYAAAFARLTLSVVGTAPETSTPSPSATSPSASASPVA